MSKKRCPTRKLKKQCHGNQFTVAAEAEADTGRTGATAEKMRLSENNSISSDLSISYVLLAFTSIFGPLSDLVNCNKCDDVIQFQKSPMFGLGFQLHMICSCSESKIDSCPKIDSDHGRRAWEVNRKLVFVMRLLGFGIHGINVFCAMMDICAGMANKTYYDTLQHIRIVAETIFNNSIHTAGEKEKQENSKLGKSDRTISVSGDGTWSKRGFSSLLGVITLIEENTGKILDLVVKSSFCVSGTRILKKLTKEDFQVWYDIHAPECSANHTGSAGKM